MTNVLSSNITIIVLSGSQTSGKSTQLKGYTGENQVQLPGIHVVPEAAKSLIEELGKESVEDPGFQRRVFDLQYERMALALAECSSPGQHVIIVERAAIDNFVYIEFNMQMNPYYRAAYEEMYPLEIRQQWIDLMIRPQHHVHFLCAIDFPLQRGVNIAWDRLVGQSEADADKTFEFEKWMRVEVDKLFRVMFERHSLPFVELTGQPRERIDFIDEVIVQRSGIQISREGKVAHITREGTTTSVATIATILEEGKTTPETS